MYIDTKMASLLCEIMGPRSGMASNRNVTGARIEVDAKSLKFCAVLNIAHLGDP